MRVKRAGKIWNWTVASKHVIIECDRSEPKKFPNWTVASEASAKFCTFPPNSIKLRSDYLFSFQKRTNYLFPAFSRSEYLFPKSARPPPPRIKWSSPKKSPQLRKLLWIVYQQFLTHFVPLYHVYRTMQYWDNQTLILILIRTFCCQKVKCGLSLTFLEIPCQFQHTDYKLKEKKEEIWLSPMTKAPTPTEMS